ncbi:GM11597 [Drosophila sechellia]|uniref:GM11597 n=2 Tax=Drosophila sechellia TaxID=7238 RepID=B4HWS4_DROSE|nr:GM11597 [Drosophila sechellia]
MTRKSRQLIAEETLNNPKESSNVVENLPSPPEKPVKEELQGAKEQDTTIPQSEEVKIEKLDQMEASTSSAAQEAEMEKPNEVMPGKEDYIDPREKIRKDMEEYFSGIQALEVKTIRDELSAKEAEVILREDQRKRTWKAMLLSVTQTTHSTSTGKPPKSAVQAIPQRTAKADFKRKMYVLKENYNYRLELLKQLKNDMKNNYKSEAQQLYIDYHSIKNQTLSSPPLKEMLDASEE